MEFIDLKAQQALIREAVERRIGAVLDHGRYIMGPEVSELENALGQFVGMKHAVACASGTDALLLALMAYGVGPGDAVFTTPFTFMATAEAIALLGATPVFVDIDPVTFNMDPDELRKAIEAVNAGVGTPHPLPRSAAQRRLSQRGIIGVDLFGLPAEYDILNDVGARNGLFVIEDGAQSLGARYKGRQACALAAVGCTSFFPAKPLGGYGDGGMCFTDDDQLADVMHSLRIHGQGRNKYENIRIGLNGRLDTLQAAILMVKLEIFPEELMKRQEVAERYTKLMKEASVSVLPPEIPPHSRSAWAQYSILARDAAHRARLLDRLAHARIPTAIYYPTPLHLQPAFSELGYGKGDFPVSENVAERIFSLPMHPYLRAADQERIVAVLAAERGEQ